MAAPPRAAAGSFAGWRAPAAAWKLKPRVPGAAQRDPRPAKRGEGGPSAAQRAPRPAKRGEGGPSAARAGEGQESREPELRLQMMPLVAPHPPRRRSASKTRVNALVAARHPLPATRGEGTAL